MTSCSSVSTGDAFLSLLLGNIDCQARALGSVGYQALANPASPLGLLLTTALAVFVVIIGLRLVLGEMPSLAAGVLHVARIGVVLTLATSWPAVSTVIYDVVVETPAQVGSAVGSPLGLVGGRSELSIRAQQVDDGIRRLTDLGSGRNDLVSVAPRQGASVAEKAPIPDDVALGWARVLFVSTIVGATAVVRFTAGVLLALTPLFAGFLLFDFARGVFVGWAKALVFVTLGSLAANLLLGVQLAILEPWLSGVLQMRYGKVIAGSAPMELLILALIFAVAMAGMLGILLRLSFAVHVPSSWSSAMAFSRPLPRSSDEGLAPTPSPTPRNESEFTPPRAASVARSLAYAQRRDVQLLSRPHNSTADTASHAAGASKEQGILSIPTFSAPARRSKPRKSLGAALRDSRK